MDNKDGPDNKRDESGATAPGPGAGAVPGLAELIDEKPGPAASTENLTSVFRRHVRRRRRVTSGIVAATLALGVGGGVAIGEAVSTISPGTPFAAGRPTTTVAQRAATGSSTVVPGPTLPLPTSAHGSGRTGLPSGLAYAPNATLGSQAGNAAALGDYPAEAFCPVNGCATSLGPDYVVPAGPLHPLFVRTANAVAVRAFTSPYGATPAALRATVQECEPREALVLEVSDAGAVGTVALPELIQSAGRVAVAEDEVVGTAEGAAMAVVAVHVGTGISAVEARFATGASDEMQVVDGWGVLVARLPGPAPSVDGEASANVEAVYTDGAVAERLTVQAPGIALPTGCVVALPAGGGGPAKPQAPASSKGAAAG
jgi:hypothetical protein